MLKLLLREINGYPFHKFTIDRQLINDLRSWNLESPHKAILPFKNNKMRVFPCDPDSIDIIATPTNFYNELIEGIISAKDRIFLSCLYFGTGELERKMISELDRKLSGNRTIQVHVLMDKSRGLRGHPTQSSLKMFEDLIYKYPKQIDVSLHQTPHITTTNLKLSHKVKETLGVQHIKAYGFDDHIIISGANLSNDYFVDRHDRYIKIQNREITDFYHILIQLIANCHTNEQFGTLPGQLFDLLKSPRPQGNLDNYSTFIVPTIQYGVCGFYYDSLLLYYLLRNLKDQPLTIATGYLNFNEDIIGLLASHRNLLNILTSSPQANSFFPENSFSALIPCLYTEVEKLLYHQVIKNDKQRSLCEYNKSGWTYHGKGIWANGINIFGSSNFGVRSEVRDCESVLYCFSSDNYLNVKFAKEIEMILNNSAQVNEETLYDDLKRKPKFVREVPNYAIKYLRKMLKSYL